MNRLVLAQTMAEYGALSGGASAFQRFLESADRVIRTPETGIPLGARRARGRLLPAAPAVGWRRPGALALGLNRTVEPVEPWNQNPSNLSNPSNL